LETSVYWLFENLSVSRLKLGFARNMQKCDNDFALISQFLCLLAAGIAAIIFRQEMP